MDPYLKHPTPTAMKTDQELGEIGARAAADADCLKEKEHYTMVVNNRSSWWSQDEPARTAFAAAVRKVVREEIFAGVEGMPSVQEIRDLFQTYKGGVKESWEAVRNLMLAAFAKQLEEAKNNSLLLCKELGNEGKTAIGELQSKLSEAEERAESKHGCWMNELKKVTELESKLAASEKRLGEIAKLPGEWREFRTICSGTWKDAAKYLEQALKPTPTSEEIERAEFEAAYREEWERCEGLESEWKFDLRIFARDEQGRYVAQGIEPSWRMWKLARASKEAKA